MRRGEHGVWVDEVRTDDRTRQRVRGVQPVVQQMAKANRRRETGAEARLWGALRGRRCDDLKFRRQHALGPYILDFYCAERRLVVEVDGSVHDGEDARAQDQTRTDHLTACGLHVLRLPNAAVMNDLATVLETIRATAERLAPADTE